MQTHVVIMTNVPLTVVMLNKDAYIPQLFVMTVMPVPLNDVTPMLVVFMKNYVAVMEISAHLIAVTLPLVAPIHL